jgi:hypothetical protein
VIDMLNRIARLLSDPYRLLYAARAKADEGGLYRRYQRFAEAQGFRDLYFVLSFDCDTREDADSVLRVHDRLRGMGVSPVYAVPGEILSKGERVYRTIAETGGDFINHGYRDHTFFDKDKGRYASCFFYDEQPLDTVRSDIVNGDRHLRETLGVAPCGFRAPHFGTFQKPAQLNFQHAVLKELGYAFSTSTLPIYAYRFGPAFRRFGLIELPVSGMGSMPLRILDSWTCFEAPNRRFDEKDFAREGRLAADRFKGLGIGLLNFYADPSHVHDQPEFFDTVAHWARIAKPVTYNQLLEAL